MADDDFEPNDGSDNMSSPHPDVEELQAQSESVAGSEPHPVFGSQMQPQEVHDKNIVGPDDSGTVPHGEDKTSSFDPEADSRMQLPATEI